MKRRQDKPRGPMKHRARAERERSQRRRIFVTTIATSLLVVAILVYGWIDTRYIKPNRPVAIVDGEQISIGDFQTRVRLALSPEGESVTIGYRILNELIDDVLIRNQANKVGITVSKADVDRVIEQAFGFYPEGTPTPASTSTPDPTSQAEITATPHEDPSPTVGPTSTPRPTATPFTREGFETVLSAYLETLAEQYDATEDDYRAYLAAQLYRERLLETFEEAIEREQEHVWIRHIRVEEKETAEEILTRLKDGEAWEDIAAELSTDLISKDSGGDLGWEAEGRLLGRYGQVGTAVFETPINEIEGPIETDLGWYLVEVMDRGVRPLDDTAYFQALLNEFNLWLNAQRETSEISIEDIWIDVLPQVPSFSP